MDGELSTGQSVCMSHCRALENLAKFVRIVAFNLLESVCAVPACSEFRTVVERLNLPNSTDLN